VTTASWTYADTGFRSGSWNMRYDTDLAARCDRDGVPVLRVYGWNPAAVSIGFHQHESDFDADALRRDGIDIVQRPTGGRAILHAHELTYSVVHPLAGGVTPRALYQTVNEIICRALVQLGVPAELSDVGDPLNRVYRAESGIPCFSSSARNEIHVGGKKIVGSAQRKIGTAILQHGSILIGPQHRLIARYLSPAVSEPARAEIESQLAEKTTEVETVLGRACGFHEVAAALRTSFERYHHVSFDEHDDHIHNPLPLTYAS
jgi:lipoate-protein ligase A